RFRYPLTYLLLFALCVISMASRNGPVDLGVGSRLLLRLTLPLGEMVTLPVRQTRELWRDYLALLGVREENESLREGINRLERENLRYREAMVSSERFKRLEAFQARREVPMVAANVITQDLSRWFQSVTIDRGSEAGVRAGMPVITGSGVVGVVAGTTPSAAKVLLVIDLQSRVDAYVQRSRARGTLRGCSEEECEFDYVLREDDVKEGDQLLTSGLGSVYPKGLLVGTVASVERKPYGLFQSVRVSPAVDFRKLEEVFVILEQRELLQDADFSAGDGELWPQETASAGDATP
ncbi:MAG: rod shape-determining protein MreC, partial [Myxococcota bacterium]